MKLTIVRLETFTAQDRIDLQKIWPEYSSEALQVNPAVRIYAARFNDRLLAAVRVSLSGSTGTLRALRVRDVTRRRGVGRYLVEETLRDNSGVSIWQMAFEWTENREEMAAFAQALGFSSRADGWEKRV